MHDHRYNDLLQKNMLRWSKSFLSAPCWLCMDGEECEEEPSLNGTQVETNSLYSKIGCPLGCWVRIWNYWFINYYMYVVSIYIDFELLYFKKVYRNQTGDEIVYARGCAKDDMTCSSHKDEVCTEYGEGAEQVKVSNTT